MGQPLSSALADTRWRWTASSPELIRALSDLLYINTYLWYNSHLQNAYGKGKSMDLSRRRCTVEQSNEESGQEPPGSALGDSLGGRIPRFVALPAVTSPRSGDLRADLVAVLGAAATKLESDAVDIAVKNAFNGGAHFGAGHGDPVKVAVAADVVRQVIAIVDTV
jgi:hypothetical protein